MVWTAPSGHRYVNEPQTYREHLADEPVVGRADKVDDPAPF